MNLEDRKLPAAGSSSADKNKRNFEFRMSKKVAELTQVVHMLFTRNHEKEVEIDALKSAYEHEIHLVIEDAQQKIAKLEEKTKVLEERVEREKAGQNERVKSAMEQDRTMALSREEELRHKLQLAEKQAAEEKTECQNLRDLLINAQRDIEKLRQGVTEQLTQKNDELHTRGKELEKLRRQVALLEKTLGDSSSQSNEILSEMQKQRDGLERELTELQELLEETHRAKEHLVSRNRQLEVDLKNLRRDFSRKVSEVVANQQNHSSLRSSNTYTDYNDEMERLRREVERYRMELCNREGNFNRMFKEKQPLHIDPKAGKIGIHHNHMIQPRGSFPMSPSPGTREKSFTYAYVQTYGEDKRPPSSKSASSSIKLPVMSADQKARLGKLVKPRPLSKELLSTR